MTAFDRAMVLAAGYSTRLRPLSYTLPKPAIPVLGKPLLHHVLDWLARFGVREVGVNLCHLSEEIRKTVAAYPDREFRFHISDEGETILRTAGALAPLRGIFRGGGTFVLANGKLVTDLDLEEALVFHRRSGSLATLVLVENPGREAFAHVETAPDGTIRSFVPYAGAKDQSGPMQTFTGIHLLEPEILDLIPDGIPYDTVADLYPEAMRRGLPIRGFVGRGSWLEFSTLERYWFNSLLLLDRQNLENWTEPGLDLEPSARLVRTVLGPHVEVREKAAVRDSLLLGGNVIGAGALVEGCILGPGVEVPTGLHLSRICAMALEDDQPEASFFSRYRTAAF